MGMLLPGLSKSRPGKSQFKLVLGAENIGFRGPEFTTEKKIHLQGK